MALPLKNQAPDQERVLLLMPADRLAPNKRQQERETLILGQGDRSKLEINARLFAGANRDALAGLHDLTVPKELTIQRVVVGLIQLQNGGLENAHRRGRGGGVAVDQQLGFGGERDNDGRRGGGHRALRSGLQLLGVSRRHRSG
jgi:hypothetical protein